MFVTVVAVAPEPPFTVTTNTSNNDVVPNEFRRRTDISDSTTESSIVFLANDRRDDLTFVSMGKDTLTHSQTDDVSAKPPNPEKKVKDSSFVRSMGQVVDSRHSLLFWYKLASDGAEKTRNTFCNLTIPVSLRSKILKILSTATATATT